MPKDILKAQEPERWIAASWANKGNDSFISTLQAMFINRDGVVIDIMNTLNNMRVPVHSISAKETKNGNCSVLVSVSAESVEHLKSIISHLEKINGAYLVERINQ